jgi:putative inorganic carbon (HCO3(-)) transporter
VPSTSLSLDRYLLAAAVLLTCTLFTAQAADPVNVIKLTALMLCALALIGSGIYRIVRYRVARIPRGPVLWVTLSLTLGLLVSTAVAPVTTTAIIGTYGRNSGLLAYGAAIVLFLAAVRMLERPRTRVLVGAVVLAGLFTSTYGLLQKAGIDAIAWNNPFNPVIAALGNPNFASGYLGIAASVAAGAAWWHGWSSPWRIGSGVTAALCVLAAALSDSVQGPIAAAAGLSIVAFSRILNLKSSLRRASLAALVSAAAAGVAVLLLGGIQNAGPAAPIFSDSGSQARVFYWEAAVDMFRAEPLLGVGLDQYGNYWRTSRSPDSVELLGGPSFADAAHSVPLQVLAQGGLVLGLAYLAFLGLTAFALIRGLARLRHDDRILLGAVGGGWTAYQVQSFVSIDQVPLLVLHFTLAGAVIAVSGILRLRDVQLPGAPNAAKPHPNDVKAKRRLAPATPSARAVTALDGAILGVAALLLLVAAWYSLIPLRANIAVQSGDEQFRRGEGNGALAHYGKATALLPGVSVYWNRTGSLFEQVSQPERARAAYQSSANHDSFDVNALKAAATHAEAAGDLDAARRLLRRAARLDPLNVETLVPAATFELRHAGAAEAQRLLEEAVRELPWEASLWATLGDARAVLDDPVAAQVAYERALELQPDQTVAIEGLAKLAATNA